MTRKAYVQELDQLKDDILLLGSMVAEAINDAVKALQNQDLDAAKQLIANDRTINEKKYEMEDHCLTLIATQNPMAGDMRLLAAILEISTELERMGDYAKGISRITLYIGYEPLIKPPIELRQMSVKALDLLRLALDAFMQMDEEAARQIPLQDDELDELYNHCNRNMIRAIVEDPGVTEHANYFSWAAHNLERAGDRVTNICERVIYTVTAVFYEFDSESV